MLCIIFEKRVSKQLFNLQVEAKKLQNKHKGTTQDKKKEIKTAKRLTTFYITLHVKLILYFKHLRTN